MLQLSDILKLSGHDLTQIAVILHTPKEKLLGQLLPTLVIEQPELFEAYQSTHGSRAQATLEKRGFAASFVGMEDSSLVFAGLYQKKGARLRERAEIGRDPAVRELIGGFKACLEFDGAPSGEWLWFDLVKTDLLSDYVGRLRIAPKLTQTYIRLAEKLHTDVLAIERENAFSRPAPDWRDMIVTGPHIRILSASWKVRLREWCGIYLIVDQTNGARYIGSASGENGFLGRWLEHVERDHGVTAGLAKHNPANFVFSILELLSKNPEKDQVSAREANWKRRLVARDAISEGLNRN